MFFLNQWIFQFGTLLSYVTMTLRDFQETSQERAMRGGFVMNDDIQWK